VKLLDAALVQDACGVVHELPVASLGREALTFGVRLALA
jgi:hypothetical protein